MKGYEASSQVQKRKNISKRQAVSGYLRVVILIFIFFSAFVPLLPSMARHHMDENYYTDSAIRMVQTGDYLTPYYLDGTIYLRKPIFIFWAISVSYKIFGINLFASRLPFLIAGCIIIWFTYKLSLLFFRRENYALIAAAVVASNFTLFHISTRSTPDAFVCLFIMISLYGFARLIFNRDRRRINYMLAYVGAGLTAATHGMWGAFPVAFAFFFWFVRKRDTIRLKELIDVRSIAISLFIACFWYAIVYYLHGDVLIQQFFNDQLEERWSGLQMRNIKNMLIYLLALVQQFLPWSVILLFVALYNKSTIINFFKKHKDACLFIIGWFLTFYVILSFGNRTRERYFFPTYPLISILYGALLATIADKGRSSSLFQVLERVIILGCLAGGCLLVLVGLFIDIKLVIGGLISVLVAGALYVSLSRKNAVFGLVTVALCIILTFSVIENFITPAIYNPLAPRVVERVREYTRGPIEIAEIGMSRYGFEASEIYVLSGGDIKIYRLRDDTTPEKMKQFQFILFPESFKERINLDEYTIEECGYSYKRGFVVHSLWSIRNIADLRALISRFKQHYYLAHL